MATFFSTSTNQRDLTGSGAGAGEMSFHHHYPPPSNPYTSDSSAAGGGLIPLPATIVSQSHIAHAVAGAGDDPTMDGGLQTQLLMATNGRHHQGGLSLSLGTQVPVSLYHQYRSPASLLNPTGQSPPSIAHPTTNNIYVQNSRFLKAARDLLDEVVNVRDAIKPKKDKDQSDAGDKAGDEIKHDPDADNDKNTNPELTASERQDLQNKVTALTAMLEQVDRRYRHYHHQMLMVSSSFDAVAGAGAARPYTALALQTISRHFRSLRDAIGAQVQSTRRSLGEHDTSSGAGAGGGLSRLRYIDQQLRQQRAMQQFGMMQQPQHAWRPQRGLPESAVSVLRAWLFEHFLHPYPKDSEKLMLARQTGLSRGQVSNWFINARVRLWKPMIEEMYKEEFGAEMDSNSSSENKGKAEEAPAISSEDRDEPSFQSAPAATSKHHHQQQQINPFKSEAMAGAGMDAAAVAGIGMYATSLNLNHHHNSGYHGGAGAGDARFMSYGDMADLGGGYDGVSLTLGLQHCNNNGAGAGGEQHGLLYGGGGGDFDYLNGAGADVDRQRFSSSSQLLHDFVA
uniref:Homeobox domain-containing protein n=1 Tax=Leersia perrieri TaxID=77586 RepID=A0A0D9VPW9_9ORYZ